MFEILLNDILEVKWWYTCGNDRALNVRHYFVSAVTNPYGVLTSLSAANQIKTSWSDDLRNLMSVNASFDAVSIQRLAPLPKSVATFSTSAPVAGLLPAAVLPRQVAGLISLYTPLAGPKHRGRFYMPYPDEGSNETNGQPTAAYIALLDTLRARLTGSGTLTATVGAATLNPIIVHRDATPSTVITSGIARPRWATQRRRQNGKF
jgi:hypothetical protein